MWADLLERILAFLLAILLGSFVGCSLMGPPSQQGPAIDQQTTATQQTVQAAPDSVVNIAPTTPTSAASDP